MSEEIPFSQKDGRRLTPFVGQELLYDYLCHKLDPERMRAIEDLVSRSRETQDEIHTLTKALNYVEQLREATVSQSLIEGIKAPRSYFQGLLQKIRFGEWPVGIKLGIEVLIVASLVFLAIIVIPWHRVNNFKWGSSGEVTLAEIQNDLRKSATNETEISAKEISPDNKDAVTFQDEGEVGAKPSLPLAQTVDSSTGAKPKTKSAEAQSPTKELPKAEAQAENTRKATATQGYLYRGTISVSNLTVTSDKFVERINDLGGRRAGEVELGWKRGDGTYFHFTIPEAKYDALVSYLNEYGKLHIQKEKHERIMPDGIIRLIISVSEDKKKVK
jgi:hypothetical protein